MTSPWSTFWITGASSGIGAALAYALSEPGTTIVLSGRSRDRLQAVSKECAHRGATVEVVAFDIANESERSDAVRRVGTLIGIPDVLINNAGVSQRSRAIDTDFSVDQYILEVNFNSCVHLSKSLLPVMIRERRGAIFTVSSIAGMVPSQMRSAYNAAKAAQIAYFRTLSNELVGTGIHVGIILPGFVRTDVSWNALIGDGRSQRKHDRNQSSGIDPRKAATQIVRGMVGRRRTIWTGVPFGARLFVAISRFAPSVADAYLRKVRIV